MEGVREKVDRFTALPMFAAALTFLCLLAVFLHVSEEAAPPWVMVGAVWGMLLLWPLFLAEFTLHAATRSPRWKFHLLCCLLPPLRLVVRDCLQGRTIWLPRAGWVNVDESLRASVSRRFSLPILIAAALVLPLLAIEHLYAKAQNAPTPVMVNLITAGAGLVWLVFCVEFLVMFTLAEKKLRYCTQHWMDLAIILLPMVAAAPLLRLAWWLRVSQVSKAARLYQLRRVLLRVLKKAMLAEILLAVIYRTPERKLARLQNLLVDKEDELHDLKQQIAALEAQLAAEQELTIAAGTDARPAIDDSKAA